MLTVNEAAARLGVAPITVRVWILQGRIPGVFKHANSYAIPPESLGKINRTDRRRKNTPKTLDTS